MSRRTPLLGCILLTISLLAASPAVAQVSDEDWGLTLSVGPLVRTGPAPPGLGPALGFRANKGIHPLWNLGVETMLALPVPLRDGNPYFSGAVFAGVSTNFDVIAVVPWIGLSAGMLIEPAAPDHDQAVNAALMASFGIDVRKHRDHSMGVQADVIAAFTPSFDAARYVRVAFRYTWMRSRSGI